MDEFEFTFSDKVALERRANNLEGLVDFYEGRIARIESKKNPRPWQLSNLDRYQERLDAINDEIDTINDELINYADVAEQAQDAWAITASTTELSNGVEFGRATVVVADSLVDATFVEGDDITVRAVATKLKKDGSTKTWRSTFKAIDGEFEDGIATFTFGSSKLGKMLNNFDTTTVSILDEFGDTIYSQIV